MVWLMVLIVGLLGIVATPWLYFRWGSGEGSRELLMGHVIIMAMFGCVVAWSIIELTG
ncbi:hypothetical protein LCGC14_0234810 [marine sediment metagenome]|uniref:Uncharacterized protein n=1 Tax=marine sediment metagenome TaxID=412755 RepID=A0A0F9U8T4_9ZZZZ